jgi:hypothetical protein
LSDGSKPTQERFYCVALDDFRKERVWMDQVSYCSWHSRDLSAVFKIDPNNGVLSPAATAAVGNTAFTIAVV